MHVVSHSICWMLAAAVSHACDYKGKTKAEASPAEVLPDMGNQSFGRLKVGRPVKGELQRCLSAAYGWLCTLVCSRTTARPQSAV